MRASDHSTDKNPACQARQASTYRQAAQRGDPQRLALRLLAIRPRTIAELTERLTKTGAAANEIRLVIEELIRERLLDDAAFARDLIESLLRRKPAGSRFLRARLIRYGVPERMVRETLSTLVPPEREQELAKDAARRKLRSLGGARTAQASDERRVLAYLLRRGFSFAHAVAATQGVLGDTRRGTMDAEA